MYSLWINLHKLHIMLRMLCINGFGLLDDCQGILRRSFQLVDNIHSNITDMWLRIYMLDNFQYKAGK